MLDAGKNIAFGAPRFSKSGEKYPKRDSLLPVKGDRMDTLGLLATSLKSAGEHHFRWLAGRPYFVLQNRGPVFALHFKL